MNTQKTYYAPCLHAHTGAVMNHELVRKEFKEEVFSFGSKSLDAPSDLPLGGVRVLLETEKFVIAIDFSVRAS